MAPGMAAQKASGVQKAKADSAKKWVERMYATVLPAVQKEQGEKYIKRYTSQDFYDFYQMVKRIDRGEVGLIDRDFWTDSQDPDENLKATVKSVRIDNYLRGEEYAYVTVILKGRYYPATKIEMQLAQTNTGWVICDYNGWLMKMKTYVATH